MIDQSVSSQLAAERWKKDSDEALQTMESVPHPLAKQCNHHSASTHHIHGAHSRQHAPPRDARFSRQ
jgi:hypothetical protein